MLSKFVFEDITLIVQLIAIVLEKAVNFWREQNIHISIKNTIKNIMQVCTKKLFLFY